MCLPLFSLILLSQRKHKLATFTNEDTRKLAMTQLLFLVFLQETEKQSSSADSPRSKESPDERAGAASGGFGRRGKATLGHARCLPSHIRP